MSKTAAYSKLSFREDNQKIKDLAVMVNLLESKINRMSAQNPKRQILSTQLSNYENSLNNLKEKERKTNFDRDALLRYIESNNSETIPAASVYSFLTDKRLNITPKLVAPVGMPESVETPAPTDIPTDINQTETANVENEAEGDTPVAPVAELPTVPPAEEIKPTEPIVSENEAQEIKPNLSEEEVYSSNFESPYISPESDIGDAAFRPLFLRKKYNKDNPDLETSTEDSEYEPPPKQKSRKEQLMEKTEHGGYISSTVHPKSEKAKEKAQLRLTEKAHPVGDETDAEQLAQLMNIPKEEAIEKIKEAHPLGKEEPEDQPASGNDTFEPTEKGYRLKTVPEKVEEYEGKSNRPSASYITKWAKHYERDHGRFPDLWLTREQYVSQRQEKGKSKGNYTEYLRSLAEGNKDFEEWKKFNKK
jgi:hypothetical protein